MDKIKIAKTLLKLANDLMSEDKEIELFDKLAFNQLNADERKKAIEYFMKTDEGLYDLLTEDSLLTDDERKLVFDTVCSKSDFDTEYFLTMIKYGYYKNDQEKKKLIECIINSEYFEEYTYELLFSNAASNLTDEEKSYIFKNMLEKGDKEKIIKHFSWHKDTMSDIVELFYDAYQQK